MKIKLLSFLVPLLFFFCQRSYADTFIVTSNADSGPGTFREALQKAHVNGYTSGIYDSILFNIPDISQAGRTIKISYALYEVSPYVVIDATSQPGSKFGISDAKVIIEPTVINSASFSCLRVVGTGVQIYGLYLRDFVNTATDPESYIVSGSISIEVSDNIKIGAPGKGNVISGTMSAISSAYLTTLQNISIKSNILGLEPDGKTIRNEKLHNNLTGIYFYSVGTAVEIGGHIPEEGNLIAGWRLCSILIGQFWGIVQIKNNKIGTDASAANEIIGLFDKAVHKDDIIIGRGYTGAEITYNVIRKGISLMGVQMNFTISNNIIGTNITQSKPFAGGGPVHIRYASIQNNEAYKYKMRIDSNIIAYRSKILIDSSYPVTIRNNSIYCQGVPGIKLSLQNNIPAPFVTINSYTNNQVSGTAPPLSKIQIFYDDECNGCNGKYIIDSVQATPGGNWTYTSANNFTSAVIVTATDTSGGTSEFSAASYTTPDLTIQNARCGLKNGSIKGIQISSGTIWHWENESGVIVGRDTNLINIGPGKYRFVIRIGNNSCSSVSPFYEIQDLTPKLNVSNAVLTHPNCGLSNGSITGLSAAPEPNQWLYWENENRDIISDKINLNNVASGRYRLVLRDTVGGCADSTNWFTLINQSGPSLTNNAQITTAICGNSNGSISGITASNTNGTPTIQWIDSLNNIVGNSLDLLNVPAGKYQLRFKDQSGCDTIITPYYIIPSAGEINIDVSNLLVSPVGCTINNGSISNIKVTGANTLQWRNLTNNTNAGNTVNIFSLASGDYQLTASNSFGCTMSSPVINVPKSQFISIIPQQANVENGSCSQNNGSIQLHGFSNEAALLSYRWINSSTNQVIGTALSITGLGAGTYEFVAVDTNGCEQTIFKQPIIVNPKPSLNTNDMIITDDQCTLSTGSITGINFNNLQGPTTYTWTNANNVIVGNSANLANIGAGNYRLTVKDKGDCIIESEILSVTNNDNAGIAPLYDDLMIPRNTEGSLIVKNFRQGTYLLYNDASATQALQQNTTGIFNIGILTADKEFYIRHVSGSCNSTLTKVKITVVDKSMFAIPGAFTPNNDGLNDKLALRVIGYIEVEYFRVYNRNGELVFSTNTINNGWDGMLKGAEQPSGAYVWMAKGKDITGKIITDKGSFVLIR